jgi:hypothetical protein
MSKNSSNSSDSPFKLEQLSEEEISDHDSNLREELHQIFQREEFKKFALANGFDASSDFDDESFYKFGAIISKDETLYNKILQIISERIEEVIKIEEFTEKELEILDKSLDEDEASESEEDELLDTQLTDENLKPFRKIVERERYYQTDETFFKKIKHEIVTVDQSDTTALSKIFTRFLNEFNDDLNGDDCDIFSPELYKDLMRRQQAFINEALTLLELDIRQKVIIDALKQSGSNLHLQENFKELISKPLINLGCSEVMAFLENQEDGNLTQSSAKSSGIKCATALPLQVAREISNTF